MTNKKEPVDYAKVIINLTSGDKTLTSMIKGLGNRVASVNEAKSVSATAALVQIIRFGNVLALRHLMSILGDTERKSALVKWACQLSPCAFGSVDVTMPDGTSKKINTFYYDKDRAQGFSDQYANNPEQMVNSLLSNPFWKHVPPAELKPYDFMKAFDQFLKTAEAKAKKEGVNIVGLDEARKVRDSLKASAPAAQAA